jgi:type IV pilus assembly protein PilN
VIIEINLLPHREAKRVAELRQTVAVLMLGLVLVAGGVYFLHSDIKRQGESVASSVRQLQADLERYKPQQAKVESFKTKRSALASKLDIIKGLDLQRTGPVRIMEELAARTPERLWLTKLRFKDASISLDGASIDTGVVADFLRDLNESTFFKSVDLNKTKRGEEVEGVKLVNFTITVELAPADSGA